LGKIAGIVGANHHGGLNREGGKGEGAFRKRGNARQGEDKSLLKSTQIREGGGGTQGHKIGGKAGGKKALSRKEEYRFQQEKSFC